MAALSAITHALFKKWGQKGGNKRRKVLSAGRRHFIASMAARARWGKVNSSKREMPSIRLENPSWNDPVYLEEILADGGIAEWRRLYRQIADHSFGETAQALEKVVNGVHIYGATPMWKALLKNLQGGCL